MIVYFADRYFNIIGQASTNLPGGLTIIDDRRVCDVDSGVTVFEFTLPFNDSNRALAESCGAVGNYLLRSHGDAQDFFTVIDSEVDTKRQEVTVYAEDAGLDLLNEIVEAYEPDKAYNIAHYINKFAYDSGFVIGVNECGSTTKKLAFTDDSTAAERIANVAAQFGCEISYSFEIDGLAVTKKLINIYLQRGNDAGVQLRLNKEVDRIITKKSIANLATALLATGGTPENAENPINLSGYKYDDGDYYLDGRYLKSRSAIQKWSRYLNPSEPNATYTGHILRKFSCDALTQKALCSAAVEELKRISDVEVNYEIEMNELPAGVGLGDRVNIVDDAGALYMSARLLEIEESIAKRSVKATIGDYLIKDSGISQKVADLAAQFATSAAEVAAAYQAAQAAKKAAETAAQEASDAQDAAADAVVIAEGAQAVLNAMEIGGRNLIKGSGTGEGWTGFTSFNKATREFALSNSTTAETYIYTGNRFDMEHGQTYTLSFKAKQNGKLKAIGHDVYVLPRSFSDTGIAFNPKMENLTTEYKPYVFTFVPNPNATSLAECQIRFDNDGSVASGTEAILYIKDVKLEKGNQATDWTPAPEDMATGEELAVVAGTATQAQTAAGAAAKTATNFMSFDTDNGLQVGDKSSGSWSGYRTQVKADSFNVLDASGKVLSSFGANKIELGKNNADAVVSFCNDRAQIKHRAADSTFSKRDYTGIETDCLGIPTEYFWVNANAIKPGPGPSGETESYWAYFTRLEVGDGEVSTEAGTREVDASGNSVGSTSAGSAAKLTWEGLDVDAHTSVYLKAPNVTLEGDTDVYGNLSATASAHIGGTVNVNGGAIELNRGGTLADFGGFIDFHFNKATGDYTSRIIEDASGQLNLVAANGVKANGKRVLTEADIEVGTWTAGVNSGSITAQYCTYQKVGNMCTISFFIQGKGGTATGTTNYYITGAPYYPSEAAIWYGGGGHVQGLYDTSKYPVTGCIIQSSNKRIYFRTAEAGGVNNGYIRVNNGGADYHLSGSITFPVAE